MNAKIKKLLAAALGAGVLTLCLRLLLYRIGFDEKNILSSSHPLHLICLALAGFMALYLFFSVQNLGDCGIFKRDFPEHPLRTLSMFTAGCLTAYHGITVIREAGTLLALARAVLALGAFCSMILCGLMPRRLRTAHQLCRGIITAFFALDMLCRYRSWSGNPQLPDYVFQIFACALLSLCSYHRLAFDVSLGKRRVLLWCSLMALYLSLVCVSGPDTRLFYLGGAFWAASCICNAEPSAKSGRAGT